jgi:hypothetical protein
MRRAWQVAAAMAVSTAWLACAGAVPASSPAAGDGRLAASRPGSAASGPHVSPYARIARQHAQEAASAPLKVNPLQHRPRAPRSMRAG